MALNPLPTELAEFDFHRWESFTPYFEELQQRELDAQTVRPWLEDWSHLSRLLKEATAWTYVQKSLDTGDQEKEAAFLKLVNEVLPEAMVADHALQERLLALDPQDEDLTLVLRNMRNEAELFREENVPLLTELQQLINRYDKVTGALTAEWDGEQLNLSQLEVFLRARDRAVRERAWRATMALWFSVRETLDEIYSEMLSLRVQVAANAGLPDYRTYAFREHGRFAYTPEDCFVFHQAIEEVVVPAARQILEKKRERLGLGRLRPWDVEAEASEEPPLQPYQGQEALVAGTQQIFSSVDPDLAERFATLAAEELLDLDTRPGKALGGFCSSLPLRQRPFIFMNGAGLHDDVQTLLHEAGHAFHAFAAMEQPLIWQASAPMEFNEVASMAMELLAAPYLNKEQGGFYSAAEAARARIEHLEGILLFLPYMAVVDAFQHWVYTHPQEAQEAAKRDETWDGLWQRYMPLTDWSGFEAERESGWQRKLHIFHAPFYYIEYGMAQVGALQIWRNSLQDPAAALAAYRGALALGGTRTLPELYEAAGASFRFDSQMLGGLVELLQDTIAELEATL